MDDVRIFIDFGSTFTKVAVLDLERETLAARVQAPSTADSDITTGLLEALDTLRSTTGVSEEQIRNAAACSSAAGGLRMVCVGLVPDYTTKAGHMAALGAGAKVVGTFSYELSGGELREIASLKPDIVLLTGGTDGGNKKTIIHNAAKLAEISGQLPLIIVAGNKSAYDEIKAVFDGAGFCEAPAIPRNSVTDFVTGAPPSGKPDTDPPRRGPEVCYTANVMPEFGKLELQPVNDRIRELFISRITKAKGVARVDGMISGVLMPTPSAVLEAAKLISAGTKSEPGFGELLLADVGGATTDIYSIASGAPTRDGVHTIGLREPYAKRTVEGDLGLYHNLDSLADIFIRDGFENHDDFEDHDGFELNVAKLKQLLSVPSGTELTHYQLLLSRLAVKTAVARHAGRIEPVPTTAGDVWVQRGKDLSGVELVIGAGGPLAFSSNPRFVLEGVIAAPSEPYILKPKSPVFLIDEKYILFAIGLLSQSEPDKAMRIVRKYLKRL